MANTLIRFAALPFNEKPYFPARNPADVEARKLARADLGKEFIVYEVTFVPKTIFSAIQTITEIEE